MIHRSARIVLVASLALLASPGLAARRVRVITPTVVKRPGTYGKPVQRAAAARRTKARGGYVAGGTYGKGPAGGKGQAGGKTRAGAKNQAGGKKGAAGKNAAGKAPEIDLGTEVQALRDRHANLVTKLPTELRRWDRDLTPVVEQMPLLAQNAYYRSVEEYPTAGATQQSLLADTLRTLGGVPETQRKALIAALAKDLGPVQADAAQRRTAVEKPFETLARVKTAAAGLSTFR